TQHQRIVVSPTSTMKENPLQYRVRGTPVPTTQTRGTNYPKSTAAFNDKIGKVIVGSRRNGCVSFFLNGIAAGVAKLPSLSS
ncbi:hypothetical protein, partial [Corynebacterium tuberculostearicum]